MTRLLSIILALTLCQSVNPRATAQTEQPADTKSPVLTPPNDTTFGLRLFLQQALADAREGKRTQLDLAVSKTEIPHYADFFRKTWPGPGESWVAPYAADLRANQLFLKNLLAYLSHLEGEVNVRSVNKNPEGGRGMEWGMLDSLALPLDIYFASFKVTPKNPTDQHELPIGYFFFIDGSFRWDSNVQFVSRAVHTVAPVYPYPLEASSPKGSVQLVFNINKDGTVEKGSIQAIHRPQMTSDPRLIQAAKDAVAQYQYMPPGLFKIKMGNTMEIVSMPAGAEPPHLDPPKIVLVPNPPAQR